MRVILVISVIITFLFSITNINAQNDASIKRYMIESVKSIKEFSEKDLFYYPHGHIKYKGTKYTVYVFWFEPAPHLPHLYILFYECENCDNVVLGKGNFLEDLLILNNIYIRSKKFRKKKFIYLYNVLKDDYVPRGRVIDRKEAEKELKFK